jgi:hypothetical protein
MNHIKIGIGIATEYGRRVRLPAAARLFSPKPFTPDAAHPASLFNGYQCYFPTVKRPRREADHSSPFRTEIKNV